MAGRPDRQLVHGPPVDGTPDGEQRRPGRGRGACLPEPVRPVPGEEREVRQRLGVGHQGRLALDARAVGRLGTRLGWPTADEVGHRRRLAGDVPARRLDDRDGEPGAPAVRGPLGDHGAHRCSQTGAAVHGDGDLPGPDGERGQLGAVQHEVGHGAQQQLVLAGGRLALHAVDHDVGTAGLRAVLGDRGQLAAGREPRAAASPQAGRGGDGD